MSRTWFPIPTRGRYAALLAALVATFLIAAPSANLSHGELTVSVFVSWVVLSALLVAEQNLRARSAAVAMLIFSVPTEVLTRVGAGPAVSLFGSALNFLVVGLAAGVILHKLSRSRKVTSDTILGGICVYLLIGYAFFFVFNMVELLHRGSFLDEGRRLEDLGAPTREVGRYHGLVYFSFVTLSTLGYGDIVPVGDFARTLSAFEAIVGQVYMTTLVAILVGLHVSQRPDDPGRSAPEE